MSKYRYYAARGYPGYMHAKCWPEFEKAHSRYDAQGRCHYSPMLQAQLVTFRGIRQERCLHCNRPLLAKPPKKEVAVA